LQLGQQVWVRRLRQKRAKSRADACVVTHKYCGSKLPICGRATGIRLKLDSEFVDFSW
jgi:hypothetical protein